MSEIQSNNGKTRKKVKQNIFPEETKVLKEMQTLLTEEEAVDESFFKDKITFLTKKYEELLDQTRLITKVSDRQQKKINRTNISLNQVNAEVEKKNIQLQQILDDLTKAKVGRRATTITGIVFIGLFLFTEAFIEPGIEEYLHTTNGILHDHEFAVGLSLKGLLALTLRPIERIVEKLLLKQEKDKKEKEIEESRSQSTSA